MTLKTNLDLERELRLILTQSGAAFPDWEARYILTYLLGCDATSYIEVRNRSIEPECLSRAAVILSRRAEGEPLQYILGETSFYGLTMKVGEGCLIPRNDTEILVSYVIQNAPQGALMADLCTGSGCISVAVLVNRPDMNALAIDISPAALRYAAENAAIHGVADRLTIIERDALQDPTTILSERKPEVIASNPPYLTSHDMQNLEREVQAEPKLALLGGPDGLDFYRGLAHTWVPHLKPVGFIAFESGLNQSQAVAEILSQYGPEPLILRDLNGIERVTVLRSLYKC